MYSCIKASQKTKDFHLSKYLNCLKPLYWVVLLSLMEERFLVTEKGCGFDPQAATMTFGLIKIMGYYDRFNKGGKKPKHQRSEKQKWVDKLDRLMSVYIRMRDSREFHYKYFRCISCGRILPIDQADNGHYCGRTHMSLRFDTRNQNAECKRCNRFSSDHLIGYRKNLVMKLGRLAYIQKHPHVPLDMDEVKRLGEQQVDLLEVMKHQAKNWSVFELQELYKYYAALILKMNKEKDNE